jgi:hypothetical protein
VRGLYCFSIASFMELSLVNDDQLS